MELSDCGLRHHVLLPCQKGGPALPVTRDEKWVHHFTPEMKSASKQRIVKGDMKRREKDWPPKFTSWRFGTTGHTVGGIHIIRCHDNKGDFNTLMCIQKAIKKECSGELSQCVILLHNNITPHKVQLVMFLLNNFYRDAFEHPTHSLDPTSSDYYLFANLHW